MPDRGASPKGLTPATTPRGNITPPGHKNVRVFVPQSLWFRLVSYSAASEKTLHDFVVAWLERATPLTPAHPSDRQTLKEPAPGLRPTNEPQNVPGLAVGLVSAQGFNEPPPGHRLARGPLEFSGDPVGPCAARSPRALATSPVPLNPDVASSRSSPTSDTAKSTSTLDDEADAERTVTR